MRPPNPTSIKAAAAEGPRALLYDPQFGPRQDAFRQHLIDSGVTTGIVTSSAELETAVLQALTGCRGQTGRSLAAATT